MRCTGKNYLWYTAGRTAAADRDRMWISRFVILDEGFRLLLIMIVPIAQGTKCTIL